MWKWLSIEWCNWITVFLSPVSIIINGLAASGAWIQLSDPRIWTIRIIKSTIIIPSSYVLSTLRWMCTSEPPHPQYPSQSAPSNQVCKSARVHETYRCVIVCVTACTSCSQTNLSHLPIWTSRVANALFFYYKKIRPWSFSQVNNYSQNSYKSS